MKTSMKPDDTSITKTNSTMFNGNAVLPACPPPPPPTSSPFPFLVSRICVACWLILRLVLLLVLLFVTGTRTYG